MAALGVHRVIERQVVAGGDRVAVAGAACELTYRELNQRANAVARHLIACGLRRGARVIANMPRSPELVSVMLAILKAGAAYMWIDGRDDGRWPAGVSMSYAAGEPDRTLVVIDLTALVRLPLRATPNLPIVTRPGDIACVIPRRNGTPAILVPHATITALQSHSLPEERLWSADAAALDVWLLLMAGRTVEVPSCGVAIAAA